MPDKEENVHPKQEFLIQITDPESGCYDYATVFAINHLEAIEYAVKRWGGKFEYRVIGDKHEFGL